MRAVLLLASAAAVAALLTGCADGASVAPPSDDPSPSVARPSDDPSPSTATPGRPTAAALVNGFWRVHDAAGEPQPSWLQFTTYGLQVFRPNGSVFGSWAGQGDAIAVSLDGWSMSLGDAHDAPWLSAAATVAPDGQGWLLRDIHGAVVARLTRDGRPTSDTSLVEPTPIGQPPNTLRDAVPGPGVTDAPADALVGVWHLADHREATLTFQPDGSWRSKPSCRSGTGANGEAGAYRVLTGGMLLTTSGPSTLIGCSTPESPSPEANAIAEADQARSFTIEGGRLTLFDASGTRTGELVR